MLSNANGSSHSDATHGLYCLKCEHCGKSYRHMSSLSRHRRSCRSATEPAPREDLAELRAKAALYDQQCESVKELKALVEKVARTPTTTNNVNINVILEQKCSRALNITDFVNGLRLTIEDLSYTQRNGFVKGVSNVFIQALQELRPAIRPIHCADKHGRRLYIRDANKWGEDPDGRLLETQIGVVTKKQIEALKAWEAANGRWQESEEGTRAYIELVQRITGESEDAERDRNHRLIQREIGKSCGIDDLSNSS